jgi:C-terminal processing protease CtpA/Prc
LQFAGSPRDVVRDRWRASHPLDLELRTERPPTEFSLVDGGRIAILTIPGWGSSQADADRRDLRGRFRRAFATLRDSSTRALIIDVRNNGGGEDEPARILFSYLARGPFRWYDRIIVNDTSRFSFTKYIVDPDPFDPGMLRRRPDGRYDLVGESSLGQVFQPVGQPFRGAVLTLMNGGSFSTSTEFVAQLKATRRATLIGEESGGAFQGNNSGVEPVVALPNTGLRLRLPLASYYMAVQDHARDRRGVMPDVARSPTLPEERAGTDAIMHLALAIARRIVRER